MLQIDKWLLSKYARGGRKYPNLDCWGLVRDVYSSLGIELPEFADLCQNTMQEGAEECLGQHVFRQVDQPTDYCLVAFFRSGKLFHVGMYYNNKLLHTTERRNCTYESLEHVMRFYSNHISVRFYICTLSSILGKT